MLMFFCVFAVQRLSICACAMGDLNHCSKKDGLAVEWVRRIRASWRGRS